MDGETLGRQLQATFRSKSVSWAIVARKSSNFFGTIWHFYEVKVAKHLSRLVRTGVAKQRSLPNEKSSLG